MRLVEYTFKPRDAKYEFFLYVLGDLHIGASNCAEDKIRKLVKRIADNPNAFWIGGGDVPDAVILNDSKRFDPSILPDWMLEHQGADNIRKNLQDMVRAQEGRVYELLDPIRDKCLGLIEGNHEYSIMKHHNRDLSRHMCEHFNCPDLTDCAFIRFRFHNGNKTSIVKMFVSHGHGGGRSSGAEPNILYRLAADKDCDIVMKGHSHTFCIHPPIPLLTIPETGNLGKDPEVYEKYAANWGSTLYTYQSGPSTYASRANFPVRPMYTVETRIRPFHRTFDKTRPAIEMHQVRL